MARIDLPPGDDEELLRAMALAPEHARGAATFAAAVYGDSSQLPTRLRELVRMRIAQLNDCPV